MLLAALPGRPGAADWGVMWVKRRIYVTVTKRSWLV